MTEFLKLHLKGKPALFRLNSIEGVLPATDPKGKILKGSFIVSSMEGMSQQVDEEFDDILESMTVLEVDIIDIAND